MRCPNCAAPVTGDELVVADPAGWWDRYCARLDVDQLRDLVAATVDRLGAEIARHRDDSRRLRSSNAALECQADRMRARIAELEGWTPPDRPVVVADVDVADWAGAGVIRLRTGDRPWRIVTAEGWEVNHLRPGGLVAGQMAAPYWAPLQFATRREADAELARRRAGQGALFGETS